MAPGQIAVGLEISVLIIDLALDAFVPSLGVVEGRQGVGLAELAVVDQVGRTFVVGVEAGRETWPEFWSTPTSKTFDRSGWTGIVEIDRRLLRRALKFGQIGRRGQSHVRRREIAGIAGVKRRAVGRRIGQADAWAELIGVDVFVHLVESQARVQRQLVGDLPLVLRVDAEQPTGLRSESVGAVNGGPSTLPIASTGKDDRGVARLRLLAASAEAEPQCVRVVEADRRVALDAVEEAAAEDGRRRRR